MVSERKQSKENSVDSRDGEVRTGVRLSSSPFLWYAIEQDCRKILRQSFSINFKKYFWDNRK